MGCAAALYLGRGAQGAVRSVAGLFIDTPIAYVLKIVWVVMLVLCLDCVRNAVAASAGDATDASGVAAMRIFEKQAAKEGALVLAMNVVIMPVVLVVHSLTGECAKLELDRNMMKRQAEQQGQFAKQLIESSQEKKDARHGVTPGSEMPSSAEKKGQEKK